MAEGRETQVPKIDQDSEISSAKYFCKRCSKIVMPRFFTNKVSFL